MITLWLLVVIIIGSYAAYRAYEIASVNSEQYHRYVSDEIYYVDSARRYLEYVFHVPVNESMYSGDTAEDYFNMEHPPVGKYIIALSMVVCGDKPICWRLPGVIEAGLIPVLLALGFINAPGDIKIRIIASLTASLAVAADPILYYSGSVAMLDIHLAFFEALTIFLFLHNHRRLALVAAGLTAAVKMSGVSVVLAFLLYDLLIQDKIRVKLKHASEDILLPVVIYILTLIPLAYYFGPRRLIEETLGALKWHTTSRPPGPPTSTPLGWILNSNPFFYSYSPLAMPAILNTSLHIIALLAIAPLGAIGVWRKSRYIAYGAFVYASVILTYIIVWLLGNHTFYSFYSVQLTPPMGAVMGGIILASGIQDGLRDWTNRNS